MSDTYTTPAACICGNTDLSPCFSFSAPPEGENHFSFSDSDAYFREVLHCSNCGHHLARHKLDLSELYEGEYAQSVYGGAEGIKRTFDRINGLPEDKSDNVGRVRWVHARSEERLGRGRTLLDVGSGLGVFVYRMKSLGWDCTALEPDPVYARHASEVVGVKAIAKDFAKAEELERYDLITFNKVLEHVPFPEQLLKKACGYLKPGGLIYIEVPDGSAAAKAGSHRQEFFVEHYHAFSQDSVHELVKSVGGKIMATECLQEPSNKFTLRCLMSL